MWFGVCVAKAYIYMLLLRFSSVATTVLGGARCALPRRSVCWRRSLSSPAWRVWSALEERDEQSKLQLARLLRELTSMAVEASGVTPDEAARLEAAAVETPALASGANFSIQGLGDSVGVTLPEDLKVTKGLAADALSALQHGARMEPDRCRATGADLRSVVTPC